MSSSQGNPNPLSTIGFLWNMGYPPPPITMDALKKMAENCVDNQSFNLPEKLVENIIKECSAQPFSRCPVILFVIQQSLHSSKIEKVSNAMELTHAMMMSMKLEFARYLNREFMQSCKNVINTNSYKDRTIGGSLKKLEKWVVGGTSGGVATDPKVQALQKRCLQMLRIWVDLTVNDGLECQAIHELHKKLSARGYRFPSSDVQLPPLSSFMASGYGNTTYGSHSMNQMGARSMQGYSSDQYNARNVPKPPSYAPNYPAVPSRSIQKSSSYEDPNTRPIDDAQLDKLARALEMQKRESNNPDNADLQTRCLTVFKKMIPRVDARIQELAQDDVIVPDKEAALRRILFIKDEIDEFVTRMEGSPEDDFADLGLDDETSPFSNQVPASCPFNEQLNEGRFDSARYSGFVSAASSEDDLIGGSTDPIPPPPEKPKPKPVDPFAALNDVQWELDDN